MLLRTSSRELQEYSVLREIQAQERGDAPPPELDGEDEDDDEQDEPDEDIDALIREQAALIARLETGDKPKD